MSNEVEIKVKSTDKTDFGKIRSKAKAEGSKAGDETGKAFGSSLRRWFGREGAKVGEEGGRRSGKGYGAGLKKWFVGEGGGLFKQIGENGGTVFGSGLLGAIKTPILGPAILGILGGAVATAAPAAGAIAAGGLVLGFGAGLAGLGLVLASKSKAVEDKWSSTMKRVGERSKLMAAPFEDTLIDIADIFDETVSAFEPTLTRVFGKMAMPVRDFTADTADAFEELIPALEPVADAANAVLDSFGPGLQDMLGKTADGMTKLAASVKENPDALADTASGVGDLVAGALNLVRTLNDVNGEFKDLTGGTSAVDAFFGGVNSLLVPVTATFGTLSTVLDKVGDLTKPVGDGFQYTATTAEEAATAAGYWTQGLSSAQLAAMGITGATKPAAGAVESLTDKFNRQKSRTDALLDSLFRLQNGYLGLSSAQIAVQAAIDAGSASVKANGKTLDINTEKGRNNKQALIELARAVNDQTDSMIRNNKGTTAAALAAEKSRGNFVRLAQQMGATKPQAEAMARSMIAIPNVTRTARLQANKKDLETKLAAAKKALADKNLTKTRQAELKAEISKLQAGIAAANRALGSVPRSKTVTITTRMVTEKIVRQQTTAVTGGHATGFWKGGTVPRLARGGSPLSAREFVAGEYGQEIVKVDGTGNVSVTPAGNTSRRMGQQGNAGGPQEVHLILEGRGDVGDFLIKMLQPAIRRRGGNLNVILAGRTA